MPPFSLFMVGQGLNPLKVPPIGVGSPLRATTSRLPSVKLRRRRSSVSLLSRFAQRKTLPAASISCSGLFDTARPKTSPPSTESPKTSTLRQLPGAPANQPEFVVVGVGL